MAPVPHTTPPPATSRRHYDVAIIGGGPGGLAAAAGLAAGGRKVILFERKEVFGVKTCAGGITWAGLCQRIPVDLAARRFPCQRLSTPGQRLTLRADHPMVVTVDRRRLGAWLAGEATKQGAVLVAGCRVHALDLATGRLTTDDGVYHAHWLVGADGAASMVRRALGIGQGAMGVGIQYWLDRPLADMEWHLDWRRFGSGYAWIFPYDRTTSVGVYAGGPPVTGRALEDGLLAWMAERGLDAKPLRRQAAPINFDYRGWRFPAQRAFLVGDAAGLASALTGEGIHPALVAGQAVARAITAPQAPQPEMEQLLARHRRHRSCQRLAARSLLWAALLGEALLVALRSRVLSFASLEMGPPPVP